MHIVDSCGWLEWFSDGALAEEYDQHLQDSDQLLIPAVVLYEVYKILKREIGEEKALLAVSSMKNATVIDLDEVLALKAADVSLEHRLAMADAIVYAAALTFHCPLYTSDADLKHLPLVAFIGPG